MSFPFALTERSVTVTVDGETHTVARGASNFEALRDAVLSEDEAAVKQALTPDASVEAWAYGAFSVRGDQIFYDQDTLDAKLTKRILAMVARRESPRPFMRFWERLTLNPSYRSVTQLWSFLENEKISIDEDGFILAYKGVTRAYRDLHTGKVDNSVGRINEMPRNKISDDPKEACHFGFHVGALEYARNFVAGVSGRIVIVKVDPADVVCVPYDHSAQKMRVCRYTVIGNYGADLSSTVRMRDNEEMPLPDLPPQEDPEAAQPEAAEAYPPAHAAVQDLQALEDQRVVDRLESEAAQPEAPATADPFDFSDLPDSLLCDKKVDALRKYARRLHITDAHLIPGGKVALLARIFDVRRK